MRKELQSGLKAAPADTGTTASSSTSLRQPVPARACLELRRVLFTTCCLEVGGAESQMVLLIEGLVARGIGCEVAVLDANGPLRSRLDALGVAVRESGYRNGGLLTRKLLSAGGLLLILWWRALRWRPDVLHAYLPLPNFLGAVAGRLAAVGTIVTARRGLGTHQDRHRFWSHFDRLANFLSTVVTVNSKAVGDDTLRRDGIAPERMVLIYNGIDVSRYARSAAQREAMRRSLAIARDEIALVTVANLIPYKGHADLLRAIAQLRPRSDRSRFFLVGRDDGPGEQLARLARALGIADRVVFLGQRKDVADILAAMDGFILPSHEEGFCGALLEAMASGLAIVATDVGGNREALAGGRFGALVPACAPLALARAIDGLLDAQCGARGAGPRLPGEAEAAQAARRTYDADRMVEAHMALYRAGRPVRGAAAAW
jgi:glycosyltransferase involved in cell wall biosynthesis